MKCIGYFPVIKWLRVAATFVKRRVVDATKGWDDNVTDSPLTTMQAGYERKAICSI